MPRSIIYVPRTEPALGAVPADGTIETAGWTTVTGAADLTGTGDQTIAGIRTQGPWLTANFGKGTSGATLTSVDTGDANTMDLVTIGASGTAIYDSTHAVIHHGQAAKVQTAAASVWFGWQSAYGTKFDHYGRVYFYVTGVPANFINIIRLSNGVSVQLSTTQKIWVFDRLGGATAGTVNFALNQWVRLEYHVLHNATTGVVEAKLFNTAESTTASETITRSGVDTGASSTSAVFGNFNGSASGPFWIDSILAAAGVYPGPINTADLSGVGSLTAAGTFARVGAAALSGAGSLTAAGVRKVLAAAALSGSGILTAAATHTAFAAASLPGNGTLASNGTRTRFGIAALTGTGSQTVSGFRTARGAAALTGTGTLTAAGVRTRFGAVALTGVGSLTATGNVAGTNSANLSGVGSLAATGRRTAVASSALSGTGTLTATGKLGRFGVAALTGTGSLTAAARKSTFAAISLAGNGTLTATGRRTRFGAAALTATGSLTAIGGLLFTGAAHLTGLSSLTATAAEGRLLSPTEGTGHIGRMTVGHYDYGLHGRYGRTSRGRISRPLAGTKH